MESNEQEKQIKVKLPLVELDTEHDCPTGLFGHCYDGTGSGTCLQCGMNTQHDADQLYVDRLYQALKEKNEQIAELKKTCLTTEEAKKMIAWIQEYADDVWVDSVLAKFKIQVGGKERNDTEK